MAENETSVGPRVMCIDLEDSVANALKTAGYSVERGTFGTGYLTEPSGRWAPLSVNHSLPRLIDMEVLFIGLGSRFSRIEPPTYREGVHGTWQVASEGKIDPRPVAMSRSIEKIGTILELGGLVVVQTDSPTLRRYCFAKAGSHNTPVAEVSEHFLGNWKCVTLDLEVAPADGAAITYIEHPLSLLLQKHAKDVQYTCVLQGRGSKASKESFAPLALDRLGRAIAGVATPEGGKGTVVLVPRFGDFPGFCTSLMSGWAREACPHLFPGEGRNAAWLRDPNYEVAKITELRNETVKVRASAEAAVARIAQEIAEETERNEGHYQLLAGTGRPLVIAVKAALEQLGLEHVVDVDLENQASGENEDPREDLHVRDGTPAFVIDIKGIQGTPSDEDSLQAQKHAMMRIFEWERTDVHSLSIINSQRSIPPHQRIEEPFRPEIIKAAARGKLALMTSWELFLLVKNAAKFKWGPEDAKAMLQTVGRVPFLPHRYIEIGRVGHTWGGAFQLVPSASVVAGTPLLIRVGQSLFRIDSARLEVGNAAVASVEPGQHAGVEFASARQHLREGCAVYVENSR